MIAVKGKFDGQRVRLPKLPLSRECPVIVIFEEPEPPLDEREAWRQAQEFAGDAGAVF